MKTYLVIFAIILCHVALLAQEPDRKQVYLRKADSAVLEKVSLDFAVPDVPAFKILGADPSNLLRPSSAKEVATVFGNYLKEGITSSMLPKNLAVEVAPGLLVKPWYTLDEYRSKKKYRFLTKTRFSFGSSQNDVDGITNVATGLRTTFLDKGDLRKDSQFMKTIFKIVEQRHDQDVAAANILKRLLGIEQYIALEVDERNRLLDSVLNTMGGQLLIDEAIKQEVEDYKKKNWNATRWDFAYALLLQSPDNLAGKIRLTKHSFWTTLAVKPWRTNNWGQILLGMNTTVFRVNGNGYSELTGNLRAYGGGNKFKGLLEFQYQNLDHPVNARIETLFTQIGVEAALFRGAWVHFGTGILNALEGDNTAQLVSNINLYMTFPEDFKLW
jgi:hypothetical protein